jgi:hypothetical protein
MTLCADCWEDLLRVKQTDQLKFFDSLYIE